MTDNIPGLIVSTPDIRNSWQWGSHRKQIRMQKIRDLLAAGADGIAWVDYPDKSELREIASESHPDQIILTDEYIDWEEDKTGLELYTPYIYTQEPSVGKYTRRRTDSHVPVISTIAHGEEFVKYPLNPNLLFVDISPVGLCYRSEPELCGGPITLDGVEKIISTLNDAYEKVPDLSMGGWVELSSKGRSRGHVSTDRQSVRPISYQIFRSGQCNLRKSR
ncbi:MAG: hypothetical protein ABIC95_00555 [archaeon]